MFFDKKNIRTSNMDFEEIRQREAENDGRTVYLYYNKEKQCYEAFGLSAYYADHVASPELSYSEELQMPVAVLNRKDVLDLRQSMEIVEHEAFNYYRLKARGFMGTEGYDKWVERIRR